MAKSFEVLSSGFFMSGQLYFSIWSGDMAKILSVMQKPTLPACMLLLLLLPGEAIYGHRSCKVGCMARRIKKGKIFTLQSKGVSEVKNVLEKASLAPMKNRILLCLKMVCCNNLYIFLS